MSEETKVPFPSEPEQETLPAASRETAGSAGAPAPMEKPLTRGQQKRRERSVFQYIAILFAAAFLLLLFTFVMEKRQHELLQEQSEEQIDDLQQSVSAVQSLSKLYEENAALKEKVEELENQLTEMENSITNMESLSFNLHNLLEKTKQSMDWFWQLDEAFVRGRHNLCRDIIATMEDVTYGSALKEYLPRESATNNGRFSPYDRYQEIYDAVN